MHALDAIHILEVQEDATQDECIAALQSLIDQGLIPHLQGSYQRLAHDMIEAGLCFPPEE